MRIGTFGLLAGAVVAAGSLQAFGQSGSPATVPSAPAAAGAQGSLARPGLPTSEDFYQALVAPATPQRTYKPLRFDEDWRWLGKPHGDHDVFDPLKDIRLDSAGDLSISFGGSARARYEYKINPGFGAQTPGNQGANPTKHDDYFLYRWYFHTDVRYRDYLRIFVEGVGAYIDGDRRNPPPTPNPSDHADLHQAFIDVSPFTKAKDGAGLTFRVGRQELAYDKHRLVGTLDWANVRRTYDGVKVIALIEDFKVEAFWLRPVVIEDHRFDQPDDDSNFAGIHVTRWMFTKDHNFSVYAYYLNRHRETFPVFASPPVAEFIPDMRTGNTDRVTVGKRFWGAFGPFDYDVEGGVQFGTAGGNDICPAGFVSMEAGYTFTDAWAKPRFSLGYDYASGDNSPLDGKAGTFDQLFPTGHMWLGYLDLVGRQNIHAGNATITLSPTKDLKLWGTWHYFCLADSNDALYNAGGAALRYSPGGGAGMHVGNELDLTATYQIGRHITLLAGYGVFFPGSFVRNTGRSETAQMLYTSVEFKF